MQHSSGNRGGKPQDASREPQFFLEYPHSRSLIHPGNGTLVISGTVVAEPTWFDEQGLPNWQQVRDDIEADTRGIDTPRHEALGGPSTATVEAKNFFLSMDGVALRTFLGGRQAAGKALFWAEVTKFSLGLGDHTIALTTLAGTAPLLFQFPVGFPDINLNPKPPVIKDIPRDPFQPPPPPEPSEEESALQERLSALLEYIRAHSDHDWELAPPIPGTNDQWEIVKRDCKEKHEQLRRRILLKEILEQAIKNGLDSITVFNDTFNAEQMRDRRSRLPGEIYDLDDDVWKCIQKCGIKRICFKFIRLTHTSFSSATTASSENRKAAIDCVNRILLECGYLIEISDEVTSITLTDDEYDRYLDNPSDTSKYDDFFRHLAERSRDSFSEDCINILLTAHGRSLGPNAHVDTGTGGLVTGTSGVRGLPRPSRTRPDPLPRHVWLPEENGIDCRTLAHEIGHVLCLEDQYDKFGDIFPPDDTDASSKQKATESCEKARAWKGERDAEVQEKMRTENIDEAEARRRVRDGLSSADQAKWDRVYNLMALGSELSERDCEAMLDCIKRHRSWRDWIKSAGE